MLQFGQRVANDQVILDSNCASHTVTLDPNVDLSISLLWLNVL